MLLSVNNIINLPVVTQSNTRLGKVRDIHIDIENQNIYQYSVITRDISHIFNKEELLIHRDQVLSITKEKMIVEDSVCSVANNSKQLAKNKPQLSTEVVAHSRE